MKLRLAGYLVPLLALSNVGPAHAYVIKHTENGHTVRWQDATVSFQVDGSLEAAVSADAARSAVGIATDAWRGLPGVPEVQAIPGAPPARGYQPHGGGNGIYLVDADDWPFERRLAVTVSTYDEASGRMLDADIWVNGGIDLDLATDEHASSGRYDVAAVLSHEMGHVLGLGESEVHNATMWPTIGRGETTQRTIETDDEDGLLAAYEGATLEGPSSGCGGATVAGRRRPSTWWTLLVAAFVVGSLFALAWRTRNERGLTSRGGARSQAGTLAPRPSGAMRGAVALAAVVVVGAEWPGAASDEPPDRVRALRALAASALEPGARSAALEVAARDTTPEVRLAAAAVLESAGSYEDRDLAARLVGDADRRVARAASRAVRALESAPPRARAAATAPSSIERLRALACAAPSSCAWHEGTAELMRTRWRGGILWSEYSVRGEDGASISLEVPGGTRDGVVQRAVEAPPPAPHARVVVLIEKGHTRGHAWAHRADGLLYGGSLGDGPAIENM